MNHDYQKDISGCGLTGLISRKRNRLSGSQILKSLCLMNDRGNGLGAVHVSSARGVQVHDQPALELGQALELAALREE